ncbi:MAG: cytochrome c-type biogenesis protein [Caulobacteraceae bacterium]
MRRDLRPLLGAALAAMVCIGAAASDPAERLHDPAREARARTLFKQIRCLVCQNESIDESDADLADDLRRLVRDQIQAGRSDPEIRAFLVQRYGEFVLLKPRFSPGNAVLWLTPFVIVGAGGLTLAFRRRRIDDEPPLSSEEEARLQALAATVPPPGGLTKGSQT